MSSKPTCQILTKERERDCPRQPQPAECSVYAYMGIPFIRSFCHQALYLRKMILLSSPFQQIRKHNIWKFIPECSNRISFQCWNFNVIKSCFSAVSCILLFIYKSPIFIQTCLSLVLIRFFFRFPAATHFYSRHIFSSLLYHLSLNP